MKIGEILKELIEENRIKLLLEIIDNLILPNEYTKTIKGNEIKFTFKDGDLVYYVAFLKIKDIGKIMIPDTELYELIKNLDNKYYLDFGVVIDGQNVNDIKTNKNNSITIFKYVFAIIEEFIKENEVNVLTYYTYDLSRDRIYDFFINKFLKEKFFYYSKDKKPTTNKFLINKKYEQEKI